jgi:hypothetical protein
MTSDEIFGFAPFPSTLPLATPSSASPEIGIEPPSYSHSLAFKEAHRPMRPGENVFEHLDSNNMDDKRRLHNIIGGWVARDEREGMEA